MVNALVIRPNTQLAKAQRALRAAQYVRMSTDHQRYSIENQAVAIGAYAQAHDLAIVRTYRDEGESGLKLRNRAGLLQLLDDVQSDRADFDHILVYDVSRWGRFQDTDESAHYEFICKQAGIKVEYCAEQFENDGSMLSSIVKNLKRVMAAEYSRELSTKVHAGQSRIVRLGFRHGGPLSYGLRRELVDENRNSKGLLKKGEAKSLQTDRVRIRQGAADEVAVVRWIFQQCLKKKSDEEIARELNRQAIPTWIGRPWNRGLVCRILRNENYIGNVVYNRQSHKLGTRKVSNSPDKWVRAERCIEPIVDPNVFQRVQRILQDRRIEISEGEMLSRLRRTLFKRGRLSMAIINNTSGLPHVETFYHHFGSLRNAYSLIGYISTERDYSFLDTKQAWADVRASLVREVAARLDELGRRIVIGPSDDQLRIDAKVGVSFRIARAQKAKEGCLTQWRVYRPKRPDRWIVVIRLADDNQSVLDYLTIPTHTLTERYHASHFTFTIQARERLAFDCFETAEALTQSLHRRTRTATKQIARSSRI
ncbi:recombinase family protein [Bradyrhizobium algeriense]|uniref:recombinase family protein n=1 Tax=Bradyrhizobium algeriense TaxID=634784 RepID=UPI000D347CF1|nr:recombinase family protein [Bradyrhizobium algeriense]